MFFRRIVLNALLVGLLAGLVLSLVQLLTVNPIIFAAEEFEVVDNHDHGSDHHAAPVDHHAAPVDHHAAPVDHHAAPVDHHTEISVQPTESIESWSPADGSERTFYTFISNISAGIGFAALLLAAMTQIQSSGLSRLTTVKGLAWGVAGFSAFFVAPGLGLPPEIPGIEAAPVEHRQTWWLFAVVSVAGGLAVMAFAPLKVKVVGPLLIAIPYLVNIPHSEGPAFTHPDPAVVETLTQLHQQFIMASAAGNLVFWLALGGLSAWAVNRFVLSGITLPANSASHENA